MILLVRVVLHIQCYLNTVDEHSVAYKSDSNPGASPQFLTLDFPLDPQQSLGKACCTLAIWGTGWIMTLKMAHRRTKVSYPCLKL